MNKLPGARTAEIVVQDLGNELLIYDLQSHKAYTLNETSKIIYGSCDGQTSFDDLKRRHKFTDDLIYLTLDKLKANDLLADYHADHFAGISRREVIRKVGLASTVALPLIFSLAAPIAAHAVSGSCAGVTCNDNNACTNDRCVPGTGCVFTPIICDDNNACTINSCNTLTGCVFTPVVCPVGQTCNPITGCS